MQWRSCATKLTELCQKILPLVISVVLGNHIPGWCLSFLSVKWRCEATLICTNVLKACVLKDGGFPSGSGVKNPPASAGGMGSIPGSGRSPGEGNGNPLQYSCLESPMDRGAWRATVHGLTKESDMTERVTLRQNLESLVINHWAVIHLPECCTYLDTWILKLIKILSCGFDATEEIAVKV